MGTDTDQITGASLMRLKEVIRRTGLSRSEIYRQIESNQFPTSLKLGERMVAWYSREIDLWIAKRVAGRKTAQRATTSGCLGQSGKGGPGGGK